jgi:cardiolipin synthase
MQTPTASHDPYLIPYLLSALDVAVSLLASGHVLLSKCDTRAAIGWIGLIWLSPLVGTVLYWLLGINRISRKARSLRREQPLPPQKTSDIGQPATRPGGLPTEMAHLEGLDQLVGRVTQRSLLPGNRIEPLVDGDLAYPAMVRAIEEATRSIVLSTYIFNDDPAGALFIEALSRAVARGLMVRVLVDDIGSRYDLPSIVGPLRRAGVPVARFLPTFAPGWMPYLNLRNHRKILVVDGRLGFTGGLNIAADYIHRLRPKWPKRDLHFRVEGPVVAHLRETFADDWAFCTGESLSGEGWFPPLEATGDTLARGIADGPDEDLGRLHLTLLGALAGSRSSITVVTPYFVPDLALISTLNVAAMSGIRVDILLPEVNNLRMVQWASTALLWQVLERGCRVWASPPPFDHTKLLIVDGTWAMVGSANWDARSLRLNFEFNVECYGRELAGSLEDLARERIRRARPISLEDVDGRALPIKLRDGLARLLMPYL